MSAVELVPIVVAILGAGGIAGSVVALLKLRPESGAIVVSAAQGALVVQTSVLNELHKENERLRDRVSTLERELAALRTEVREDRA
jgi:cell division protein FtsB